MNDYVYFVSYYAKQGLRSMFGNQEITLRKRIDDYEDIGRIAGAIEASEGFESVTILN